MEKLTDRKKRLLQAVVDSYITSAEPISSAAIQQGYMPDVSTATIRSELAGLEEMGYLVKPHVSAGRVPSSKAYRFYVDRLMENVTPEDIDNLEQEGRARIEGVESVVKEAVKVVSDVTNYTSLMVLEGVDDLIVRNVKLVSLGDDTALVVIITDGGVLRDNVISLPAGCEEGYLDSACAIINGSMAGKSIKSIAGGEVVAGVEEFKALFDQIVALLRKYAEGGEVYVEGADKIFAYPEYRDVENVKGFLSVISQKDKLHELTQGDGVEITVKIGAEEGVKNMAVVSARYSLSGRQIGHVGVIGPERMDYKKVIKVLTTLGKLSEAKGKKEDGNG
ncbi:MAG TPA: heat-inducible transcription repressor HrcA [Candidatus Caccalectryoclostridium excrementigallinarum]|uniref:Heat-inducible transcription repressor HrcA n=1 Tax=Candidatus Caccalectryoclostridium excrementigallinarum TaxID=2840710 RepID=A0A9D1SK56_9FIRM|nr:heat-inducible transcription repressor HrcA [Candidatus Caccalectryoclostridium excrementigallinarum]